MTDIVTKEIEMRRVGLKWIVTYYTSDGSYEGYQKFWRKAHAKQFFNSLAEPF